jgi:hypothetical protein
MRPEFTSPDADRRALAARPVRAAFALACAWALLVGWPGTGRAQLGPGDLQIAHALTANTAAWAVLRQAVHILAAQAAIEGGMPSDDSADTIAVLLAIEDGGGRIDPVLAGAARAALLALKANDEAINRVFASQGLTQARARAIACLLYGSGPEGLDALAEGAELTAEERAACPDIYARFRKYWVPRAFPLRRAISPVAPQPVTVELGLAGGGLASARAVLIAGRTVESIAAYIEETLVALEPLRIEGRSCGAAETRFDPQTKSVTLCYELVRELANGVERGLSAGR